MDIVGISEEEQDAIFRVVAAILHLGNVEFAKGEEIDSSKIKDEKSLFHLKTVTELLKCDLQGLEDALCKRVMVTREETIIKSLDPEAATTNRDALAKTIYSRLFDWIVEKINSSIGQDSNSKNLIGVLDIYGFESFKTNSFEQFCINFTNEKLQQHFNQHVFKMEQEEYKKEEINWSYIEFVDNQDVLDLIEKKPGGIISLLDEACMFPRSTHETFAQKLYQTFKNHTRFSKPKLSRTNFTIVHYAGDVTYQADQFLDKNKDYVVAEHQDLLSASKCPFVAGLFPPLPEETSKSSKFSSIGTRFKQQLQQLMETLNSTEPHYIRCVKPNNLLKPAIFENKNVIQQLRCGGVLEAIRISCAGYPTRRLFDEFIDRFGLLAPEVLEGNYDEKIACAKILEKKGLKGYQLGKTKVFLRAGQMAELDARRAEVLGNAARIIQRQIRTYITRKEFVTLRNAAICLQASWRGQLACKLYYTKRREAAATRVQKNVRLYQARTAYTQIRSAAIIIQAAMCAMSARNEFWYRKKTKAATLIQAQWRGHKADSYYKSLQKFTVVCQCAWRSRVARRELRKFKMAARETGALKEAKDKLEKRVEELTWLLQLEKRLRTDAEQAKEKGIAELQSSLQAMQAQLDEANAMVLKEREAAKKAIEEAPPKIMQVEVPVVDTEMVDQLTKENEELKALLKTQEEKAEEAEKKFSDSEKLSEERLKKLEEAVSKTGELQESLQRLEEKLLNIESENHVLRQQALSMAPKLQKAEEAESKSEKLQEELQRLEEKMSSMESENQALRQQASTMTSNVTSVAQTQMMSPGMTQTMTPPAKLTRFKTTIVQRTPENGHLNGDHYKDLHTPVSTSKKSPEVEQRPQKTLSDRQQENQDALIKCISEDLGFDGGKPVAASSIYKSLLHWRTFEAERTNVFDRIIQVIGSAIENQENNDTLAYWLSNTSTLLFLLQRTLKASGAAGMTPQRRLTASATLFGRMASGFRSSPSGGAVSFGNGGMLGLSQSLRHVEAKYPALLFKQQVTAFVEKIYGMIRDNLKKEISPFLSLCIQAPRANRAGLVRGQARSQANAAAQKTLIGHWKSIVASLHSFLKTLRANYVPPFLVRKIFTQIFSYVNVQLFNSLLLRRECCSFSNGEYVKAGLAELEQWCCEATEEYAGSAWDELKHIRQAVGFLVIHQKPKKSLDELTHDLCPMLSIQQLYRISTMYSDDKYGTYSVAPDVLQSMRVLMSEDSNTAVGNTFLLDDDSSIPFSAEDVSKSIQQIDISEIKPPRLLRENSGFNFLLPRAD
eukprot:TRINITY_DN6431_c0_g2_i1.p1 TRINITY_DN6431_c0_g2~~TRINITY_DN6431_c0_g2_i1.p1  ORF type:complete len:1401 (-),score=360.91 TRINITY_DN6431_c0_g2_i1:660-4529(-)